MPAIYYNNRWSIYDLQVVVKSSDAESHDEKKKFSGQGHWISNLFDRMVHQFIYQRSLFASVENKTASLRFIMARNVILFFYG